MDARDEQRKLKAIGIGAGIAFALALLSTVFGHTVSPSEGMLLLVLGGLSGYLFCP